jgi:hypothetical protein
MEKKKLEKQYSNSFKKVILCKKTKCSTLQKKFNKIHKVYNKELEKQCPKKKSLDEYTKCSDLFDTSKTGKLFTDTTINYLDCTNLKCKKEREASQKSYEDLKSYENKMAGGNDSSSNTNNKKDAKECETKFCKSYFLPSIKKSIEENIKKMDKHFTRKMSPSQKKDYFEKQKEKEKTRLKEKAKTLKKDEKRDFDSCVSTYCNKGCKNTVYEDGEGYPASLENYQRSDLGKTFKNDKKIINNLIEMNKERRAEMFKNKSTVLKDNFYEKLNKKTLKLLKSKKATSGCTNWNIIF